MERRIARRMLNCDYSLVGTLSVQSLELLDYSLNVLLDYTDKMFKEKKAYKDGILSLKDVFVFWINQNINSSFEISIYHSHHFSSCVPRITMDEFSNDEHDDASMARILFLGLTPLGVALLLCLCLSLCIQLSRSYSNWRLRKQLTIVRSSEQFLIVANRSIDQTDLQLSSQVV